MIKNIIRFFKTVHFWLGFKLLRFRNKPVPIVKFPHPALISPAAHVQFELMKKKDRVALLQKLHSALNAQEWGGRLGIAAPQIGISLRVCVVMGIPMFNPVFVAPTKDTKVEMIEGCYSLEPDDLYRVERSKYGWVKWYDVDGKYHDEKVTGIKAIVAQHELSHLDGKCCNQLGVPAR